MRQQFPIVAYFAVKWTPRRPMWAVAVMAALAMPGFAAIPAVYYLT